MRACWAIKNSVIGQARSSQIEPNMACTSFSFSCVASVNYPILQGDAIVVLQEKLRLVVTRKPRPQHFAQHVRLQSLVLNLVPNTETGQWLGNVGIVVVRLCGSALDPPHSVINAIPHTAIGKKS